jgi:YidC/Oxa1 family membrane protein insertase
VDDKRNLIIAILLTGLILFGWPYVASQFFPTPAPVETASGSETTFAANGAATSDTAITSAAAPRNVPLATALRGQRVMIETPKLRGSINLEGARFDDLLLLAHRTALAKDSPPVRLFAPSGTAKAHFARFGWVGQGATLPDDKTVWTPSGTRLTPETPVTLSWTNAEGQRFEIVLGIDKDYMITAEQRFTNGAATAVEIAPFGLLSRNGQSPDPDTWNIHVGPMGVFNGEIVNVNYDEVIEAPKGELDYGTTGGWLGETEKYWLSALIPDQKVRTNATFKTDAGYYWSQMVNANQTRVAPGATFSQTSRLFAGAK